MSAAILYITDKGLCLAHRLKTLYRDAEVLRFRPDVIPRLWSDCERLVFIMAAGIVVRTIAPLIKDKRTDPAVVVLDETGRFAISLLSGHVGGANEAAKEIARFLGGEAVITTASDVNNLLSIDLWALGNNLVIEDWGLLPRVATRFINNGALRVYADIDIELPDEFLKVSPRFADVLITNKKNIDSCGCKVKDQLYLRPKNIVAGIGCNSGTTEAEIEKSVQDILDEHNLSFLSLNSIATIEIKGKEPGLVAFAVKHGLQIETFSADELNRADWTVKSETVFKATGAYAVAGPAALLASGNNKLLINKQKRGNMTMAAAEIKGAKTGKHVAGSKQGSIYIVGTGPGNIDHITPYAQKAIKKAEIIVGYDTYLDLVPELIKGKEVHSTGMTKETERCNKAVELAEGGKTVAVISGGDPGIYAMAGLVFELLSSKDISELHVEVIPGISALNACASRLGAPLMHDFASISLSDRLTPWALIEKRLEAAAMADFVIVLYNPKSKGRAEHINAALDIILKYRKPETPVGIVKAAMRENESVVITDLKHMLDHDINMQTTVIIGNSQTFKWGGRMVTPRGYSGKYGNK